MRKTLALPAVLLVSFVLSGCSGEPSAANMKQAIADNPLYRTLAQMGGGDLSALQVEKGQCTKANSASGYVCDLRVGQGAGGQAQFGPWSKGRFFEAGGGWQFEEIR